MLLLSVLSTVGVLQIRLLLLIGRIDRNINLLHQLVLFGIFLQLVADSAHDILNFGLEELLKRADGDRRILMVFFLNLFLIVENGDDMSVMLAILVRRLPIVEIDQHVGQVLVQSIFDSVVRVVVLLLLIALLLLLSMIMLLLILMLLS